MSANGAGYSKARMKESDTRLAAATRDLATAMDRVDSAIHDIHRAAGDSTGHHRRSRHATWEMTLEQALAAVQRVAQGDPTALSNKAAWNLRNASERARAALSALESAQRAAATARQVVDDLDAVWRDNGRWPRYFQVEGGHIHCSTGCHSLHPTTRIFWLPDVSGENESEAVAAYGPLLCSHCFSSAPVEWTTRAPTPADPDQCTGTGRYVPGADRRLRSPRGTCPECGGVVSVTSLGNARKHRRR